MGNSRIKIIESTIKRISFVEKLNSIEQKKFFIDGNLTINFTELKNPLDFYFRINPEYPLKSYDTESITFINEDLIPYNHVMESGNICIHTSHHTELVEKLKIDFDSLKQWITKYYINGEKDLKFEHIIVNPSTVKDLYYSYSFTALDDNFTKDEYGFVDLSSLNPGFYNEKVISNSFVQKFTSINGKDRVCQWSTFYKSLKLTAKGIYLFLGDAPAIHNKFAFRNWSQLDFSTTFLNFLHDFEKSNKKKFKRLVIPLFLGYKINKQEIHWQVALLEIGKFPLKGIPIRKNGKKTGNWESSLISEEIKWGLTRNVSYQYFFGRGVFSKELTEKRILIIGIGAVGSMVAQTLTRCGCRFIDFIDYDTKEPENVCRSEYKFSNGITTKPEELINILNEISPFLETNHLNNNYFERLIKSFYTNKDYQKKFKDDLKGYNLIIDCSTDNDLMFVLNELEFENDIINMSITNHAKELVCAFQPNAYRFVNNQFSNILKNDTKDLYEPTGCWNPTFRASYNDINTLVQFALKHINKIFKGDKSKNNFVIKGTEGNLKITEY